MNIVSKRVIDAWMQRYKKEMSSEEYKAWAKNFDEQTVVRVELDGVEFITRDYVREKDLADEIKN
jgi:hypothetical protein